MEYAEEALPGVGEGLGSATSVAARVEDDGLDDGVDRRGEEGVIGDEVPNVHVECDGDRLGDRQAARRLSGVRDVEGFVDCDGEPDLVECTAGRCIDHERDALGGRGVGRVEHGGASQKASSAPPGGDRLRGGFAVDRPPLS
ncbi:hypothetical protein [Cellulosimicrobium sp. TH-20]|uniref:hypothetical protein n=1 Tax=Cellulosimicrobium sp. TH-20 TaxID=1980001 RepID=UPI001643BA80|nr:hypothetical protein [Cellulosimicrobium sp. TH-20]